MLLAAGVAVVRMAGPAQGSGAALAFAFVAAVGLAAAAALAASLSVLGDVAVARSAIAGEPAGVAVPGAVRAFLARPAALLGAVLAVGLAAVLAAGAVQGFLGALAGGVRSGPKTLLLFPELALAVIAALLASAAEMWRLGAVGVLALGGQEWREARPKSLRSDSLGILPPSQ
jgi:hypothetical protein